MRAVRRCAVCGSRKVVLVAPGQDGARVEIGGVSVPVLRETADLALCLDHVLAVGWPWPSEAGRQIGKGAKGNATGDKGKMRSAGAGFSSRPGGRGGRVPAPL
jgi:hypothetical protein